MWTLPPTVIKEDLIPKGRDMQKSGGSVLEKYRHRRLRRRQEDQSGIDQLELGTAPAARLQAGARQGQSAGLPEDQFRELELGLHARLSEGVDLRPQLPRGELGLRARAEHRGARGLAAAGPERLGRRSRSSTSRRAAKRKNVRLKQPVPLLFRLHHRLGDGGRRRAVPPRHLPEGRGRRDRCGILELRAPI